MDLFTIGILSFGAGLLFGGLATIWYKTRQPSTKDVEPRGKNGRNRHRHLRL